MSNLVIVESPAKAKTIKKYLGSGYEVVASMGHIRDLPKSKIGVDIEHGFKPDYIEMKDKKELISSLKKQAKKSDKVYLATDPDREGEAISWHLAYILGLDLNDQNRVTFNEITKSGVKNGMEHPRTINIDLVNAQQARRILDRIVGYKLSPFLWKKVRRGLSAGRVQSVTVRLIVRPGRGDPQVRFGGVLDHRCQAAGFGQPQVPLPPSSTAPPRARWSLPTRRRPTSILAELEGEAFTVGAVKKGIRRKSPAPPFIHLDPPAGGLPQAGLPGPPHHEGSPGALRRRGGGGHGRRGSHYLHAYRLAAYLGRGPGRRCQVHRRKVRHPVPAAVQACV